MTHRELLGALLDLRRFLAEQGMDQGYRIQTALDRLTALTDQLAAADPPEAEDGASPKRRSPMEQGEIRAAMVEVMNIMLEKGRDAIERMAEAVERLQAVIDQIDAMPTPEPPEEP